MHDSSAAVCGKPELAGRAPCSEPPEPASLSGSGVCWAGPAQISSHLRLNFVSMYFVQAFFECLNL